MERITATGGGRSDIDRAAGVMTRVERTLNIRPGSLWGDVRRLHVDGAELTVLWEYEIYPRADERAAFEDAWTGVAGPGSVTTHELSGPEPPVLLPPTPFRAGWAESPDPTTLLVMADWLEEQGHPRGGLLRKLVRLWQGPLPYTPFKEKWDFDSLFYGVPFELCPVIAAGVAARCAVWLGDRYRANLADLLEDLTETPEEDRWWRLSPGAALPVARGRVQKRVGAMTAETRKGHAAASRGEDPCLAFAYSNAVCAAGRIAQMRPWDGSNDECCDMNDWRQCPSPASYLFAACLDANRSRLFFSERGGRSPRQNRRRKSWSEHRWQLSWITAVVYASGGEWDFEKMLGKRGYGRVKRIAGASP